MSNWPTPKPTCKRSGCHNARGPEMPYCRLICQRVHLVSRAVLYARRAPVGRSHERDVRAAIRLLEVADCLSPYERLEPYDHGILKSLWHTYRDASRAPTPRA